MEKKKPTSSLSHENSLYGRIPPQAVDLEEAVLGAILLESGAIEVVVNVLKPESFYKEAHQKIYASVVKMFNDRKPIDIISVTEYLKCKEELSEVGGALYISQLTGRIASASHLDYHAHIVAQKYIQRELIRVSSEIQSKSYDDLFDVDELMEFAEVEIRKITDDNINVSLNGIFVSKVADKSFEIAKKKISNREKGIIPGINTGFGVLQDILGGWQPSDLIYVAARPSMGKTAIAIHFAKVAAMKGVKVLFFSLEMNDISITDRIILGLINVDPEKWRNGMSIDEDLLKYEKVKNSIRNWQLLIYDSGVLRPSDIYSICRRELPELVIIDYIGLMKPNRGEKYQNRNLELGGISHELKIIAKDFKCPVIALSQLNRRLDTTGTKIPTLSDLRDSGELEQDADIVIFPFRPYIYSKQDSDIGIMDLIISKHRNGRCGAIRINHNEYINNFFDQSNNEFQFSEIEREF